MTFADDLIEAVHVKRPRCFTYGSVDRVKALYRHMNGERARETPRLLFGMPLTLDHSLDVGIVRVHYVDGTTTDLPLPAEETNP